MNKLFIFFCVACISGGLWACSQYSNAPLSVGFHNVNAKFNALFQANIKFKEAQQTLFNNRQDNFDELLSILIPIDSSSAQAVGEQLNSVIKKASLVVERHQNSKWIDDAYVLIGKARLMNEDYKNAIETFKFVNTNAENNDAKDAALIGLMRAYTEKKEFQTALRVAEILREEPLNQENTIQFYLTKAYLHQLKKEYKTSVAILEETLPLMPKNEEKARLFFVVGQMYELLNNKTLAASNYKAVNKNRPNYDLGFHARLNQYAMIGQSNNFQKMLKDPKNNDLQDKIYVSMAMAEIKKENFKLGLERLKAAVRTNQNPQQLPFTYLRLADVYYNNVGDYEMAYYYYDSTASTLSQQDPQYKRVAEKKSSLADFVQQTKIIKTEDSLQRLAKMSPEQLEKVLEKAYDILQKEKVEQQRIKETANRGGQLDNKRPVATFTDPNKPTWYFTNPLAVSQGKIAFVTRWGNRVLEDNWRRSSKENMLSFDSQTNPANKSLNSNVSEGGGDTKGNQNPLVENRKTAIAALKAKIPFAPEALLASKRRQEEATFVLGRIYKLNLNEPQNAIITFEKFLRDFPNSTHQAEVYYLLCLLHENNPSIYTQYKNQLLEKFPESYFARLLIRSQNASLSTDKESEAQKMYAEAYNYFSQNDYEDAYSFVETALKDYPNSQIEDKFIFLKAVLLAKTKDLQTYKTALENFIVDYPKSQLIPLAKERLLAAATQK
ncbi:type IX secretion system periplasmic lipoprotein PorW/SprE [Arcicella rigui]|uniref:Tetratricopeptide repeat protein n=1 Tax=Arcicella rigui TaxID=797020 RepID=A0ABU5Q7B1_9BACT|nr:tetratricopeptide repeat protein [Arcicella rigui]MEA5138735.1 tetratricopeptide repeat protein [Arcicella rigui]